MRNGTITRRKNGRSHECSLQRKNENNQLFYGEVLGVKSRLGDKLLRIRVVRPQNGTAVYAERVDQQLEFETYYRPQAAFRDVLFLFAPSLRTPTTLLYIFGFNLLLLHLVHPLEPRFYCDNNNTRINAHTHTYARTHARTHERTYTKTAPRPVSFS